MKDTMQGWKIVQTKIHPKDKEKFTRICERDRVFKTDIVRKLVMKYIKENE